MSPTERLLEGLSERLRRLVMVIENQRRFSMSRGDEIRAVTEIRRELEAVLGYLSQARTAMSRVKLAFQTGARVIEQKERDTGAELQRLETEIGRAIREVEERLAGLARESAASAANEGAKRA